MGSKQGQNTGWRKKALDAVDHPTTQDICVAAGLFEGEGSFGRTQIEITQKVSWILERCRRLFGGTIGTYQHNGYRPGEAISRWNLHGSRARGFVMTIYKHLSPTRKCQAKRFLGVN